LNDVKGKVLFTPYPGWPPGFSRWPAIRGFSCKQGFDLRIFDQEAAYAAHPLGAAADERPLVLARQPWSYAAQVAKGAPFWEITR